MLRRNAECLLRTVSAERILVIKPSALGDVVQSLPLLPVLRRRFPQAQISWLIQTELRDLVSGHPDLDDVITCARRPSWTSAGALLQTLRSREFDLVFDLQGLLRSALMTWATGARWRVGLETAREGASLAVNLTLRETGRDVPAHARYWRVAAALGCGDAPRVTHVAIAAGDWQAAHAALSPLPRPILAVQAGARWETKRWPVDKFADLLDRALATWGGSVVLVGSSNERADCVRLEEELRRRGATAPTLNLAGRTSLKQLAAVLQRADAVVSNDSGPMHLAAELGTPTLGIFTCTSPQRSGPPGERHELIATRVDCAAGYHKTCPWRGDAHLACHRELEAWRVWNALERLFRKNGIAAACAATAPRAA